MYYRYKFLGPAHSVCNMRRMELKRLHVFLHNFKSYDSHFIVNGLSKFPGVLGDAYVIPESIEKLKCIVVNNVKFLDSFAFLSTSLESMTETLRESSHTFPLMHQIFGYYGEDAVQLLFGKMAFPYEFFTNVEQMATVTQLPPREEFFSRLTNSHVAEEDYNRALEIYQKFQCQNFGDFVKVYVLW